MKKGNLVIALILEAIGVLIIVESFKLEIKSLNDPGAGFFPLILAISLCLLGLPICINALRKSVTDTGKEAEVKPPFGKIATVIGSLAGYAVFLNILGSLITIFLLLWGLFWMGNPRRWFFVSGLSALVAVLSYVLFVVLLQVPFPAGILR